MRTVIRRLGNSQGVSIPRSVLEEACLAIDSPVEMAVDGHSIVLRKIDVHPRGGWADDAALLRDADDAALLRDAEEDSEWIGADLDPEARAELA